MKKIALLIVACLICTLCAALAEFSFEPYQTGSTLLGYIVNCNEYVTMRASASTSASALARLSRGSRVEIRSHDVYGSGDYFVQVSANGTTGYVLIDYLDIDTSTLPTNAHRRGEAGTVSAKNATDDLIVRTGPGTGYAAVSYLFGGEALAWNGTVKTDAKGIRWYECELDGDAVYISAKYTQATPGTASQKQSQPSSSSSSGTLLPTGMEFGLHGYAWYTSVYTGANNHFSGDYHHREYEVTFEGDFDDVRKIDAHTIAMTVRNFKTSGYDETEGLMGLEGNGDRIYIYLPGTPRSALPADASWFTYEEDDIEMIPDPLTDYVLYDATTNYCFKRME